MMITVLKSTVIRQYLPNSDAYTNEKIIFLKGKRCVLDIISNRISNLDFRG